MVLPSQKRGRDRDRQRQEQRGHEPGRGGRPSGERVEDDDAEHCDAEGRADKPHLCPDHLASQRQQRSPRYSGQREPYERREDHARSVIPALEAADGRVTGQQVDHDGTEIHRQAGAIEQADQPAPACQEDRGRGER